MEVIHFESTAERIRFLKHGYEEIIPKVAENDNLSAKSAKNPQNQPLNEENSHSEAENKPKKKKASKKVKKDEVQAE